MSIKCNRGDPLETRQDHQNIILYGHIRYYKSKLNV